MSTKGVSRPVCFGMKPAKAADSLVETLSEQEASVQAELERLFKPRERVRRRKCRVMVLIELLSMQVRVRVVPPNLRKVGSGAAETFLKVMMVWQNAANN